MRQGSIAHGKGKVSLRVGCSNLVKIIERLVEQVCLGFFGTKSAEKAEKITFPSVINSFLHQYSTNHEPISRANLDDYESDPGQWNEIYMHVEIVPQCAFNAIDDFSNAEFAIQMELSNLRVRESLKAKYFNIGRKGLHVAEEVRKNKNRLPVVHQTWKTHELKDPVIKARQMSWLRNGFRVILRDDDEALLDIQRLTKQTNNSDILKAYSLLSPVQKADFWRYSRIYLEGGIYSDIDIGARPETSQFFSEKPLDKLDLIGIIENSEYDKLFGYKNYIGHFNWHMGVAPLYSRLPQMRQSFFYCRKGHPRLLELVEDIAQMVIVWEESGHTSLGKDRAHLKPQRLKEMVKTGEITLEMTGPGVWTDHMLTPLKQSDIGLDGGSLLLTTSEGHGILRYSSMGSWKSKDHKADTRILVNAMKVYVFPLFLICCCCCCRRNALELMNQSKEKSR